MDFTFPMCMRIHSATLAINSRGRDAKRVDENFERENCAQVVFEIVSHRVTVNELLP